MSGGIASTLLAIGKLIGSYWEEASEELVEGLESMSHESCHDSFAPQATLRASLDGLYGCANTDYDDAAAASLRRAR